MWMMAYIYYMCITATMMENSYISMSAGLGLHEGLGYSFSKKSIMESLSLYNLSLIFMTGVVPPLSSIILNMAYYMPSKICIYSNISVKYC